MKYPTRIMYKKNLVLLVLILVVFLLSRRSTISYTQKLRNSPILNRSEAPATVYLQQPLVPITYETFLSNHNLNELLELPESDRCELFFQELPQDWKLPDFNDDFKFNLDIYNGKEFFNQRYKLLKKQFQDKQLQQELPLAKDEPFDQFVEDIFAELEHSETTNLEIEASLLDGIYNFRTYASCTIGKNENTISRASVAKMDRKMFPWFSFLSPVYEKWDGSVVDNFRYMRTHYPDETYKSLANFNDEHRSFWTQLSNEMYGKGIVVSISDKFVDDLVNLLKLLRYHKNVYPVQFVHKGDLSVENRKRLVEIARKEVVLQDLATFSDYKQEVWFVNLLRCISEDYAQYFGSYANKWLLVLFNSFEEIVLMDTDVLLFVPPAHFFKMPGYQETGLYFFKDRFGIDSVLKQFPQMWQRLFPSMVESTLFNVPQLTNHTLQNNFFTKNSRHIMEAGVVVVNRRSHLPGLLLSTQIQLWQPLTVKLHGEKDLFWLGQSMMGNEQYRFNGHYSGAAGELVEDEFEVANLVISALPAHLDSYDNRTILWLNSGLTYCKKNSWEKDAQELFKGRFTELQLKLKYQSLVTIDSLVVPPEVWKIRDKDSNEYDPEAKEPTYSWRLRWELGCGGYLWSAHSVVDDVKGVEVRYNDVEKQKFHEITKVWGAPVLKIG